MPTNTVTTTKTVNKKTKKAKIWIGQMHPPIRIKVRIMYGLSSNFYFLKVSMNAYTTINK